MKLLHYNSLECKWVKFYVSDRKQIITSNGQLSRRKYIFWGVPQGSILGPILLLLYKNDLAKKQMQREFTIFADDTTLAWYEIFTGELKLKIEAKYFSRKGHNF